MQRKYTFTIILNIENFTPNILYEVIYRVRTLVSYIVGNLGDGERSVLTISLKNSKGLVRYESYNFSNLLLRGTVRIEPGGACDACQSEHLLLCTFNNVVELSVANDEINCGNREIILTIGGNC